MLFLCFPFSVLQLPPLAVGILADEDSEVISVYVGTDISQERSEELYTQLVEEFPDFDVEMNRGDQKIYFYIISVE